MAAASGVAGLEGAPLPRGGDRIRSLDVGGGVELMRARFAGRAYAKHRHDNYAIGVTDFGVQAFDYRGSARTSTPGRVVVLHPDEPHDGRAGSAVGFGYRIAYVPPRLVAEAARALCGAAVPLPFVEEAVAAHPLLEQAIEAAFLHFPAAPEPLAVDALVEGLTRGLVEADRSVRGQRRRLACDLAAIDRARQLLEAERARIVASDELERVTGHDRFSLARQFRRICGTSPYRYLLMRRLDLVRDEIRAGKALAEIALDAGFADQAHMTRVFVAAHGMSPAAYRAALTEGSARPMPPARRPSRR
jgi:AraC-like DNA-binding protein